MKSVNYILFYREFDKKKLNMSKLIPLITAILIALFIFEPNLHSFIENRYIKYSFRQLFPSYYDFLLFVFIPIFLIISTIIIGKKLFSEMDIDITKVKFIRVWINGNWYEILFLFPITVIMEEFLFRGVVLYLLDQWLSSRVFICVLNSILFGLYHLGTYSHSKDIIVTALFITFSFGLGLFLSYFYIVIGLWGCISIHLILAIITYTIWIETIKKTNF